VFTAQQIALKIVYPSLYNVLNVMGTPWLSYEFAAFLELCVASFGAAIDPIVWHGGGEAAAEILAAALPPTESCIITSVANVSSVQNCSSNVNPRAEKNRRDRSTSSIARLMKIFMTTPPNAPES
ncbi:MAG: hypothetical protein VXW58_04275, partial [Pseudomonadota bacterium]|nr:hypothetical protein [Pseudomonadota bacterium]